MPEELVKSFFLCSFPTFFSQSYYYLKFVAWNLVRSEFSTLDNIMEKKLMRKNVVCYDNNLFQSVYRAILTLKLVLTWQEVFVFDLIVIEHIAGTFFAVCQLQLHQ